MNRFLPAAIVTYCLPPALNVIGDAFRLLPMEKCQSALPVLASSPTRSPSSSAENTNPPAVETVPAHINVGPGIGNSQRSLPVFTSSARR